MRGECRRGRHGLVATDSMSAERKRRSPASPCSSIAPRARRAAPLRAGRRPHARFRESKMAVDGSDADAGASCNSLQGRLRTPAPNTAFAASRTRSRLPDWLGAGFANGCRELAPSSRPFVSLPLVKRGLPPYTLGGILRLALEHSTDRRLARTIMGQDETERRARARCRLPQARASLTAARLHANSSGRASLSPLRLRIGRLGRAKSEGKEEGRRSRTPEACLPGQEVRLRGPWRGLRPPDTEVSKNAVQCDLYRRQGSEPH